MSAFDAAAETIRHKDPLLRVTKVLLYSLMVLAVVVAAAMVVAIPGLWFVPNQIVIDDTALTRDAFGAVTLMLALFLAMAVLAAVFLRQIIAIIDSVKLGSPFVPENARRLRQAAWSVVAIEALGIMAEPIGEAIKARAPGVNMDVGFSLGWLVTALLLFILARVFDQGTRLAEDVEGMV